MTQNPSLPLTWTTSAVAVLSRVEKQKHHDETKMTQSSKNVPEKKVELISSLN